MTKDKTLGFITPIISGVILGFVTSKMLFLQWITLIPWGLGALIIGYLSKTKKQSLVDGSLYGFFLGFIFMIGQYNGTDSLITKVLFFVILGLVTALCSTIAGFIGYLVNLKTGKNSQA